MNSIKTKELKKLLFSHGSFIFGRKVLMVFINIYIWKLTDNISAVAIFNIIFFIAHSTSFAFFAKYVKAGRANLIKNLGLFFLIIFYFILFLLKENVVNHLLILPVIWGIINAMYWIAYHTQNFDHTHTRNRANYTATERSLRTFVNLTAPIIGGFLITLDPFGLGYGNIFLLGMLFQSIAIFIGSVPEKAQASNEYHPIKSLKYIWSFKDQRKTLISNALASIGYTRGLDKILTIFLFIVLGTELKVGFWISIFSIFSIVTTLFVGKYIEYNRYKKIALLSSIFLSGSILNIAIFPGFLSYVILGSVTQVADPLIGLARRIFALNILHKDGFQEKHRVEFMVIREIFNVAIGGSISLLPLIFFKELTLLSIIPVIIMMSLATLTQGILINSIKVDLNKI